jgi:GT2 family glycosyltransferase/glycosyltransferase involved in cell wall biosynthesis
MTDASSPVDIVVPVYNAPDDLRRCIESVLACTKRPFALVLIDDGSTDPGVEAFFAELANRGDTRIELLRNRCNLGFTATANRGMTRSRADVVLLNSDTIVTLGWLDALLRCAATDPSIATVTPFSNNAEICSFPRFCDNNEWDAGVDPERIREALAAAAVPTYPDLPTGVGFCMLVRRTAIDAVGTFDAAFGAGYGEENDFCLRAARAGLRNVLADDAFVVHTGGRSFAGRKGELGSRNLALLERLHPHYSEMVRAYVASDPLRPLREAAQLRLDLDRPAQRVLHVVHDRGGGTEAYVRTLIAAASEGWAHYVAIAVGDRWRIEGRPRDGVQQSFLFTRRDDETWPAFIGGIVATFDIALVHVHHLSRSRDGALAALPALPVPYGFTIHDLWLACPTVTLTRADDVYCGGITESTACNRCLADFPAWQHVDIDAWREAHGRLLASAAFLIAPSRWAAGMLERYFEQVRGRVEVIAHATVDEPAGGAGEPRRALTAVLMPHDDVPTVAVVGAIGRDKGARRVERLVERVRARGDALRFVVVGYLDVQYEPWQSDDGLLTVHGPYDRTRLRALFAHYGAQLVLYPSEGPESFSYTLSETWRAGMPALVPPIGALAVRVERTQGGWILTADEWRDDDRMLDRIVALLSPAQSQARDAAARRAASVAQATARAMSDATLALYRRALAAGTEQSPQARFTNARIRDAAGYRAWSLPPPEPTAIPGATSGRRSLWRRLAARALAMRRTPMGRLLYRVTPEPLIDALKSRLQG